MEEKEYTDSEIPSDDAIEVEDISQIEKTLEESDPEIFKGISEEKKNKIIRKVKTVVTMHRHSGPLPSPDILAAYSSIIPNGAERIMQMTEMQLRHRIEMEKFVITGQMRQSNRGQYFAFILGIITIISAAYCIIEGHDWTGGIIGIGGLTGLVTAFIRGQHQQSSNLKEKQPE